VSKVVDAYPSTLLDLKKLVALEQYELFSAAFGIAWFIASFVCVSNE
jgi:hypothetical protein